MLPLVELKIKKSLNKLHIFVTHIYFLFLSEDHKETKISLINSQRSNL